MRAISLFSGVGGFELGFQSSGIETALQVEINPDCRSVLERHWPRAERMEDVKDVDAAAVSRGGRVDLVYGGFPCQDISSAGKYGGLGRPRSGLWWQFQRVIAECLPAWVVVENVPRLLRIDHGRDFQCVIQSLDDLGYGLAWSVLDARQFGLPHKRERLFVVGHLGDGDGPRDVLHLPGIGTRDTPSRAVAGETPAPRGHGCDRAGAVYTFHCARSSAMTSPSHTPSAFLARYSRCLDTTIGWTAGQGGNLVLQGGRLRRYTPRERERLMGWPDDHTRWRADGSEVIATTRCRMTGNGVAAPVARWLGERLVAVDAASRERRSA